MTQIPIYLLGPISAAVLFAAVGGWLIHSGWPDILIGLALASLFLHSAFHVLREALKELKSVRATNAPNNFNA